MLIFISINHRALTENKNTIKVLKLLNVFCIEIYFNNNVTKFYEQKIKHH